MSKELVLALLVFTVIWALVEKVKERREWKKRIDEQHKAFEDPDNWGV